MSTRGKTTPASTGGSFRAQTGERSRVAPDETGGGGRHRAKAGPVRVGARDWGYTVQDMYDPDNHRRLGLSLHTGYVAAHRNHGTKYGLTATGHHWSGIAAYVTASDKMTDINDIASRTHAASDSLRINGERAWASMVMDTVDQTATLRLRTDESLNNGARDWRVGTEVRMHRNPDGDWEVDNVEAGYISHGEGKLRPISDDPSLDARVTETVEWFHRNLNYWNDQAR